MTELNMFNVWLNCSSTALQKGTSGYMDPRKWNAIHATNHDVDALRTAFGEEAR